MQEIVTAGVQSFFLAPSFLSFLGSYYSFDIYADDARHNLNIYMTQFFKILLPFLMTFHVLSMWKCYYFVL